MRKNKRRREGLYSFPSLGFEDDVLLFSGVCTPPSITGRRRREQGGQFLEGVDKKRNAALLRRVCKAIGGPSLNDDTAEIREFTIGEFA